MQQTSLRPGVYKSVTTGLINDPCCGVSGRPDTTSDGLIANRWDCTGLVCRFETFCLNLTVNKMQKYIWEMPSLDLPAGQISFNQSATMFALPTSLSCCSAEARRCFSLSRPSHLFTLPQKILFQHNGVASQTLSEWRSLARFTINLMYLSFSFSGYRVTH